MGPGICVCAVCALQERLWKRRAAYQIGHAAAAEGRRRLEKAAAAKEAAAKSSSTGRGSKAHKKEEAEQQLKEQQSIAGGCWLVPQTYSLSSWVMLLRGFACMIRHTVSEP